MRGTRARSGTSLRGWWRRRRRRRRRSPRRPGSRWMKSRGTNPTRPPRPRRTTGEFHVSHHEIEAAHCTAGTIPPELPPPITLGAMYTKVNASPVTLGGQIWEKWTFSGGQAWLAWWTATSCTVTRGLLSQRTLSQQDYAAEGPSNACRVFVMQYTCVGRNETVVVVVHIVPLDMCRNTFSFVHT